MFRIVRGYCPESGNTGHIAFTKVKLANLEFETSYQCTYAEMYGCAHRGDDGQSCPLFLSAE